MVLDKIKKKKGEKKGKKKGWRETGVGGGGVGGGGGGWRRGVHVWRVECRNVKSPLLFQSLRSRRNGFGNTSVLSRPPTRKEVHSEDALDHASKPDIAPYFREHLKIGNKLPLHSRRGKLFGGCGLFKGDLKQKVSRAVSIGMASKVPL